MIVTVTVADEADVVVYLEVPDHLLVANFKVMCQREIYASALSRRRPRPKTIPAAEMVLIADIRILCGCLFEGREEGGHQSQSISFL